MTGRGRAGIAVGVASLFALAWAGVSYVRPSRHELEARSLGPSLTEQFAAMMYAAESSKAPAPGAPQLSSGAPAAGPAAGTELLRAQETAFASKRPKSPLELQQFRTTTAAKVRGVGGREGTALLTDLNPRINDEYVLELRWRDGEATRLHLENARPEVHRIVLDPAFPSGLVVAGPGESRPCDLWSDRVPELMRDLAKRERPYTELCGGDVLVRHRTRGSRTAREWAADFLRSNVPGGEGLTTVVKNTVYPDAFLERAEVAAGTGPVPAPPDGPGFPLPALVSPEHRDDRLVSRDLGISTPAGGEMLAGRWYPAVDVPGVFVSLMTPGRAAREVLEKSTVRNLDAIEADALVYLIAFDLEGFNLGFALGTDHPGVGWSERTLDSVRDPALPGPDGFSDLAPLEPTGMVPPQVASRVIATFAGGFKRAHGAFHSGPLARVNSGTHYGFVEGGTVLSKLQPGLATLFALDDGSISMKTWTRADDALLERVRFARQNGVPILERDPRTDDVVPGALVGRWGEGNWGGSQVSKLRSVRASAAVQASTGRRFLVFAYFSSATPSAMAVVLASFGCEYAMHLDMNAPEHTYLALYRAREGRLDVEHLVRAMGSLDKSSGGTTVPRFLAFADNRDFFYLMRKRRPAARGPAGTAVADAAPAPRPRS